MAGRYGDDTSKKSNITNIILIVVALLSIVTIFVFTFATISLLQGNPNDPTVNIAQTLPSQAAPTDGTAATDTSVPPTEPPVPQEALELMADADFIAAGYDYAKAIAMLEGSQYYAQVPAMAEKVASYRELDSKLVVYDKPETVTHVFFHSLIVDTDRAFDGDNDSGGYNMYMTTIDEFIAMMESMYEKGFVLVSPYDVAHEVTDETGTHFAYGEIRLPAGKKPFLMSQDDLNYYGYMVSDGHGKNEIPKFVNDSNDGFAHKIVIGEDGYPKCEYMDADGNLLVGDYDLVPVLETFIQQHPDFSYHGARAMLGVTGYEGVLGYRTKPGYNVNNGGVMSMEDWNAEVEAAKAVVQCLKDHGWLIVSHSYGHPAYGSIGADRVRSDSQKWEERVQFVVGDTDIILYPYGSDIAGGEQYTFSNRSFAALYEHGYRYFFNVDSADYWNQLGSNYFRGARRNLDGVRMYYDPDKLDDLFDVDDVFDKARPTPVPKG